MTRLLPCLLVLCTTLASAQSKPTSITISAVVAPKGGPPVDGLQQQDFLLTDNKTPRPITSFRQLDDKTTPVDVILVVDAVNTSYANVVVARDQIDRFLRAGTGKLSLYTSLFFFRNVNTQVQESFTTNGSKLADLLDASTTEIRAFRPGDEADVERLQHSMAALAALAKRQADRPGRKLVLWFSPGWPLLADPEVFQLSGKQQEQIFSTIVSLSQQLRDAGITLYNIDPAGATDSGIKSFYYKDYLKGVSDPGKTDAADLSLQVLAMQSGGLVLNYGNDLVAEMRQCLDDANHMYELTFDAPAAQRPNEYHHIELKAANPTLVVRTRDGYYTPSAMKP